AKSREFYSTADSVRQGLLGSVSPTHHHVHGPLQRTVTDSVDRNRKRPDLALDPGVELPRQRPTLPRRYQRSTIGPGGLNFRVRDGNGCGPSGIATGNLVASEYVDSRVQPNNVAINL